MRVLYVFLHVDLNLRIILLEVFFNLESLHSTLVMLSEIVRIRAFESSTKNLATCFFYWCWSVDSGSGAKFAQGRSLRG